MRHNTANIQKSKSPQDDTFGFSDEARPTAPLRPHQTATSTTALHPHSYIQRRLVSHLPRSDDPACSHMTISSTVIEAHTLPPSSATSFQRSHNTTPGSLLLTERLSLSSRLNSKMFPHSIKACHPFLEMVVPVCLHLAFIYLDHLRGAVIGFSVFKGWMPAINREIAANS
jgi:hypothetical protein